MPDYKVVLEIELDANSPLEAAKTIERWIREGDQFTYIIQDDETNELYSVDLLEDDGNSVLPLKEYEPLIK